MNSGGWEPAGGYHGGRTGRFGGDGTPRRHVSLPVSVCHTAADGVTPRSLDLQPQIRFPKGTQQAEILVTHVFVLGFVAPSGGPLAFALMGDGWKGGGRPRRVHLQTPKQTEVKGSERGSVTQRTAFRTAEGASPSSLLEWRAQIRALRDTPFFRVYWDFQSCPVCGEKAEEGGLGSQTSALLWVRVTPVLCAPVMPDK